MFPSLVSNLFQAVIDTCDTTKPSKIILTWLVSTEVFFSPSLYCKSVLTTSFEDLLYVQNGVIYFAISSSAIAETTGFCLHMERSKTQKCKNIFECVRVCVCCNRAVKPIEGKVILALRQGKNLSAGLSTSSTGPVHTSPTLCILYHFSCSVNLMNDFMH